MGNKLYVGNLLYEVDDQALNDLFSPFGTVTSAQIIKYRDTGRSKGFGFVEFENAEDAQKAIDALNGQDNQGRRLVVSEARPVQPRQPGERRGGFGGGDRGGYRNDRNDQGDRGYDEHNSVTVDQGQDDMSQE